MIKLTVLEANAEVIDFVECCLPALFEARSPQCQTKIFNIMFVSFNMPYLIFIFSCRSFLEWEDRELSTTILCAWLIFWYYFDPWMGPLLVAALFPIMWFIDHKQNQEIKHQNEEDPKDWGPADDVQNGETIPEKIKGLPEMTLTITDGIEYMVSLAERLYNLATFKVPFLTILTMLLLAMNSALFYFVPCKYLMMGFGIYKYARKRLEPERVLNNDLLDFLSRIPDNKILRDWKELSVPEPQNHRNTTRSRTYSKSISI